MSQTFERIMGIVDRYAADAERDAVGLTESLRATQLPEQAMEVLSGLISRQLVLAQQLAQNPRMWSGHTAPLLIRAMADVHITLVWIAGLPGERADLYVKYSLGQVKLEIEHRKARLRAVPDDQHAEYVKWLEEWLTGQRYAFLTEVNVGAWGGKSTREMAEEAGCLDFYNHVYSPFSACTHSTWFHLCMWNLVTCANPLHGLHKVAEPDHSGPDPFWLYLGGKYLDKTLTSLNAKLLDQRCAFGSFRSLAEDLQQLAEDEEGSAARGQEPVTTLFDPFDT